jgi:hypothetical protein
LIDRRSDIITSFKGDIMMDDKGIEGPAGCGIEGPAGCGIEGPAGCGIEGPAGCGIEGPAGCGIEGTTGCGINMFVGRIMDGSFVVVAVEGKEGRTTLSIMAFSLNGQMPICDMKKTSLIGSLVNGQRTTRHG